MKKITLTTPVNKALKRSFFGRSLRERLDGNSRQDVCFDILRNPKKYDSEAVHVARIISTSGGKISVSVALEMMKIE